MNLKIVAKRIAEILLVTLGFSVVPFGLAGEKKTSDLKPPCAIFFSPGALASSSIGKFLFLTPEEYFSEYMEWATQIGCVPIKLKIPQDANIDIRAIWIEEQYRNAIQNLKPNTRIWVVAHSLGGLDWRYLLSRHKDFSVEGVIGLGVPYQGSKWADFVVHLIQSEAVEYRILKSVFGYDLKSLEFMNSISTSGIEKIQKQLALDPASKTKWYYADLDCGKDCHYSFSLLRLWNRLRSSFSDKEILVVTNEKQIGDGLVESASQKFGDSIGRFSLDHLATVKPGKRGTSERKRLFEAMSAVIAP